MKRRSFLKSSLATSVAVGTMTGAQAASAGKRELTMVTTWPKGFPGAGTAAARIAKRITALTDGRISIKLYGGGELVPGLEVFDTVRKGDADLYHSAEYYWTGKHPAFAFFASVPMGFTAQEMNAWIMYGGGQQLWDEVSAKFGLKAFASGNTGVQMGGWFNQEINSVEDLKGLKMRMPGLGGTVLSKLGGSAQNIPASEIFQALQTGVIDAAEWAVPWNDLAIGFYQATKYYYIAGYQEPGLAYSTAFNKAVWDSFSDLDKKLIQVACEVENVYDISEYYSHNGDALEKLIKQYGVELRQYPDAALAKASKEVLDDIAASDPLTGKVYESYKNFMGKVRGWSELSEAPYVDARRKAMGAVWSIG
ncbi:MAG: TRAP transporter substrate-binding protein [Ostreibacterium sp.]